MLRKLAAAIALSSGMLGSGVAYGLGLGNATLDSSLHQKLDAEIELIGTDGLTVAEILPSLATAADFKRAGLQRPAFLSKLNFDVVTGADNKPYIRLTSKDPVVEPFLNFLLEVHWPEGRLLKEYTLLLDLPSSSSDMVEAIPQITQVSQSEYEVPADRTPEFTTLPDSSAEFTSKSPLDTYRVHRNDTLSQIAYEIRPPGVSINRMMAALQAVNPAAFINGNVNLLRQGVTLIIPDHSMLDAIDETMARRSIYEQEQTWRQGRGQIPIDATPRSDVAASVRKTEEGRLNIIAGGGAAEGQGAIGQDSRATVQELESALAVNQEELDSLDRENTELKERLTDLENQIGTLEKLVVLRNDQLAAVQELSKEPVEKAPGETDVVDVLVTTGSTQPAKEIDYNFNSGAVEVPAKRPPPAPRPLVVDDVFRPPVDEGIGIVPIIGGSAVALLTLLGGLLFLRRRQEQEIDDIYEEDGDSADLAGEGVQTAQMGYPGFASNLHRTGETAEAGMTSPSGAVPQNPSPKFDYDYDDDLDNFMDDFDNNSRPSPKPDDGRGGFEFDLDHDDSSADNQFNSAADTDIDLDLDALEAELEGEVTTSGAQQSMSQDFNENDFHLDDLEADLVQQSPAGGMSGASSSPPRQNEEENWDDELSLDDLDAELVGMNNTGTGNQRHEPDLSRRADHSNEVGKDEIGTMLDLARAYVDMGDEEGARDILEEIVADGSAAQRAEAEQLLNRLS